MRTLFLSIIACSFITAALALTAPAHSTTSLKVQVLDEKPHNRRIFSQGMLVDGNDIIASSGLYGRSFLTRYNKNNGARQAIQRLPDHYFAEGITVIDGTLYLLTWHEQTLLTFDARSLRPKGSIAYQGEGWGLTDNGKHFIMSDGTQTLYFRDLKDFSVERTIKVRNAWRSFSKLNELEWALGHIWANMWQSSQVLKINPDDGRVVGIANLDELVKKNSSIPSDTVLNGIAYDTERNAFWVTGKLWPRRYLVRFSNPN